MKDLLPVRGSLSSPQKSHIVLRFWHKTLSESDLCQYHRFCLEYGKIVIPITTVRQMSQLSQQNKWPKQYSSVEKWDSFCKCQSFA